MRERLTTCTWDGCAEPATLVHEDEHGEDTWAACELHAKEPTVVFHMEHSGPMSYLGTMRKADKPLLGMHWSSFTHHWY